tara:strand:+ start:293 stop:1606 length:1314 start_codon:yes stop_codon:yes gene_type:complete
MILEASQRGGAKSMAQHLLRADENEHVEVHEISGFVSNDVLGALMESYAISKGTRCRQFMLSVSFNPPPNENVPINVFEQTADAIEQKLGLEGQPRVLVFHEKHGRRHAHCVWSRIDAETMKAVNLPHFKLKLQDISRQLFLEHGWKMPLGLMRSSERDPFNFNRKEWRQAQRLGEDHKAIRQALMECWAVSESKGSFVQALKSRGFYLARGDRRDFVAVDYRGEVFGLGKRMIGAHVKEMRARLGDAAALPSIADVREDLAKGVAHLIKGYANEIRAAHRSAMAPLIQRKHDLVEAQREERRALAASQKARWDKEQKARNERMSRGFRGVWDRLTGKHARIRKQNELEAEFARERDRKERDDLVARQIAERRDLHAEVKEVRERHQSDLNDLRRDMLHYAELSADRSMQERFNELSVQRDQGMEGATPQAELGRDL